MSETMAGIVTDLTSRLRSGSDQEPQKRLSDLGNAERLVARHGVRLRHSDATGFLVWDGMRWKPDDTREPYRMAADTARSIRAEASELANQAGDSDSSDAKQLRKQAAETFRHALKSESEPWMRRMLEVAKSHQDVVVTPRLLDRDPWLLNTPTGTVDLRDGTVRPHQQTDLITKLTAGSYRPGADCPRWKAFLTKIFNGDKALIRYVQGGVGYAATGHVVERVMFLCLGETGANGKSTFLETIRDVLGDYADEASSELFLSSRWGQEPHGLVAALRGRRFIASSETDEGRRIAEARVKQLTGGDTLTGRFLYRDQFSFPPTHTLFLATNNLPDILSPDQPLFDRLPVIPFEVRIPEAQRDKWLKEHLAAERDGILAWIIEGAMGWAKDGLPPRPEKVAAATASYRTETDRVQAWIEERCNREPKASTESSALYRDFVDWWRWTGQQHKPPTQNAFGRMLTKKEYAQRREGTVRLRDGLTLRPRPVEWDHQDHRAR